MNQLSLDIISLKELNNNHLDALVVYVKSLDLGLVSLNHVSSL